ncbi:hypothetical protein ACFL59_02050 [Planctomycetota bacterium]
MGKAESIQSLRDKISAQDKAIVFTKPMEEAIKYLAERYKCSDDSAMNYVAYMRSLYNPDGSMSDYDPTETFHVRFDNDSAAWVQMPPEKKKPGE